MASHCWWMSADFPHHDAIRTLTAPTSLNLSKLPALSITTCLGSAAVVQVDYMQTDEFQRAIEELMAYGTSTHKVIMCAEAVPWRCHRWLISDALLTHGWTIMHIFSTKKTQIHTVTPFAKHSDGRLIYPAETQHPTLF